jgi:hypothetical protein
VSSRIRHGLVLSVLSCLVLAGCSLSGQKPGLITPAQANGIVKTFWSENNKALQSSDPKVWTTLESGLQEQNDEANTAARVATNRPALQPAPVSNIQVYVSRQTSYPAFFTASAKTVTHDSGGRITSTPDVEILDFSKPGSSDRWKLINSVSLGTNPLPQFQFDSDGYVVAPGNVGAPSMKPARVSSAWADYVNGVIAGKPEPGIFAPGDMTTTFASDLKTAATPGPDEHVHVEAFPEEGYQSQTLSDGRPFVFFTDTYDVRHEALVGFCTQQGANRQNWGGLVAPGHYSVIDFKAAVFALALVPLKGTKQKVLVYGYGSGYHADVSSAGC